MYFVSILSTGFSLFGIFMSHRYCSRKFITIFSLFPSCNQAFEFLSEPLPLNLKEHLEIKRYSLPIGMQNIKLFGTLSPKFLETGLFMFFLSFQKTYNNKYV